jgi:hypothetical protein
MRPVKWLSILIERRGADRAVRTRGLEHQLGFRLSRIYRFQMSDGRTFASDRLKQRLASPRY